MATFDDTRAAELRGTGRRQSRRTPKGVALTPGCNRGYEPLARRRIAKNPFKSARFRQAIRRRERGRCFYCGTRLRAGRWGLDHIVSRAQGGAHTAANAAACCCDCNREKGEQAAADFLRSLQRSGRITAMHLRARFAALSAQMETLETGKQKRKVGKR